MTTTTNPTWTPAMQAFLDLLHDHLSHYHDDRSQALQLKLSTLRREIRAAVPSTVQPVLPRARVDAPPAPLWAAYAGSVTGSEITLHRTRRAALEAVCSALGLDDDLDDEDDDTPIAELDDDDLQEKIIRYCERRSDDWEVSEVEVPA